MEDDLLDDLDRQILHLLRLDARNISDTDIADETGVTSTTVNNRIRSLEDNGVIRGYHPDIDYEETGYSLVVLFICTIPLGERSAVAEQVLKIPGVVNVRETMASEQNLHVEIVAQTTGDVEQTTQRLDDLGLNILRSDILANESVQPWNVFSDEMNDEDDEGGAGS
ncbi:Lrp/AsnC family transcriptional regulator [Halorussus lipolyticus]|uniref:Lrp/AsnC family transcriptional regulator n=1 Tax=Halorussus lipolyticus TaxID=3034024 RepID=UPI0023E8E01E|nr:winged helix-turn-helix transcriptional regulator [Halorussus sp. DT80]